jgi:hypothetical protein
MDYFNPHRIPGLGPRGIKLAGWRSSRCLGRGGRHDRAGYMSFKPASNNRPRLSSEPGVDQKPTSIDLPVLKAKRKFNSSSTFALLSVESSAVGVVISLIGSVHGPVGLLHAQTVVIKYKKPLLYPKRRISLGPNQCRYVGGASNRLDEIIISQEKGPGLFCEERSAPPWRHGGGLACAGLESRQEYCMLDEHGVRNGIFEIRRRIGLPVWVFLSDCGDGKRRDGAPSEQLRLRCNHVRSVYHLRAVQGSDRALTFFPLTSHLPSLPSVCQSRNPLRLSIFCPASNPPIVLTQTSMRSAKRLTRNSAIG